MKALGRPRGAAGPQRSGVADGLPGVGARPVGKPRLLLAMRHRRAPRVALTVAWIEIVAFVFFHGIPFEVGPSKPYWGDGMADPLQWLGFALILACSVAVVRVARPLASDAMRPLETPAKRGFHFRTHATTTLWSVLVGAGQPHARRVRWR